MKMEAIDVFELGPEGKSRLDESLPGPRRRQRLRSAVCRYVTLAVLCAALTGCLGIPDNASPVRDFELERYLGTWYEIARLDHRFERGLSNVEAQYGLRDDGGVSVINRGYAADEGKWRFVEGKAYFIEGSDVGRLKVSFFGPFYGAYNIIALDQDAYEYALVAGPDTSYLWILARAPQLDAPILDRLVTMAASLGFPVDDLIFPSHEIERLPDT